MATIDLASQPAQFFHFLSRYQIGYTFIPNSVLAAATKAFSAQDYRATFNFDNLSVIMCGGEATKTSSIAAADSLLVRLGAKASTIKCVYGLSEVKRRTRRLGIHCFFNVTDCLQTCSACFYNTACPLYDLQQGVKFASVGKHLPQSIRLRVLDENGNRQIPNVPGAIQLTGDIVFKRYHNNDAATKACMTSDNWFDTGDLGYIDSNGSLRVIGRSKEIVIINGNNYSSSELEYAIESSGVIGITPSYLATFASWDDSSDSESVVVVFNFDQDENRVNSILTTIEGINKAVVGFCAKQPFAIIPVPKEQMPKSTLGKLSRRKLKEQFEAGSFDQYRIHSNDSQINGAPMETKAGQINGDYQLSPMERKIAEIFSDYTNASLDVVTSPDGLHHLGVDSIGYMRIRKSLQETFRFEDEIPMAKLLGCSSIHDLELTLLSLGSSFGEYDPIVPFSVRGSKTPLFFAHSGNGDIMNFVSLKPFLADRPVYALKARGLLEGEGIFENLETMIE